MVALHKVQAVVLFVHNAGDDEHGEHNRDDPLDVFRRHDCTAGQALYRVPEILTLGRFPDARKSDSTWRTQEVHHVGSDNWLSNRVFKSYDDLVHHCCEGWNNLVDQPWRILSIGLRQWARC